MIKIIAFVLVAVHIVLFVWAAGGMIEWSVQKVPWTPFSNPLFPRWLLFIHWFSIIFSSTVFICGYFTNWYKTPDLMVIGYGMMAIVCIIETFGYMTSKTKFLAMGLEFAAYIIILFILYNPNFRNVYFK